MKFYCLAAAAASAAALCPPALVWAQQAPSPDVAGATAANAVSTVVVTANRAAAPIEQVGQSVSVITGAAIRDDQETEIADILVRTPGLNLDSSGGPGEAAAVFIRGAESDQTVVLIDGVKVNDVSNPGDGFDFSTLLAGDISRIEVLRGPQSTLYGSEAIGGVINVVTADVTKPLQGDARLEGGSFGSTYLQGAIGGKEDHYEWRLGVYYNSSDGIPAFDRALGGQTDRGFHAAGLSGRFRYDVAPGVQLDERVYYAGNRSEFDGYDTPTFTFGDDPEFGRTQQVVDYTGVNLSMFDGRLKSRLALQYNEDDNRDEAPYQPSDPPYSNKATFDGLGRVTTFEYEGTYALAPNYTLVFGADDERSTVNTSSPAFQDPVQTANKSIDSGYGQISGQVLPGLTLTGGVRYDWDSAFGGHTTGQASAAWTVRPGTILRASYGGGFKAPSLYQLYSAYGNNELRPESANGWDAGVEQHLLDDKLVVQATYFGRKTTDLIEFVACESASQPGCTPVRLVLGGFYGNVAKDEAEGVELQAAWRPIPRLDITANYTFDDDQDRSGAALNDQLARRPKTLANLAATYAWPVKLSTTLAVRYASRSFDQDTSAVVLAPYTLIDLRASYPLRDNLEVYGRVENLTDKVYETAYQYGQPGRGAYGGVRVKF